MNLDSLTLRPIGIIHTPYNERCRAPRQPGADGKRTIGVIELEPKRNFEQALEDLAGFERIWILFWFHLNATWKPKIMPPRGSRKKRGVFGTRSPHRPNPLGLSLVRLLEVSGRVVRVEGTDILDGTPVLDLKPYIPYAEAFPDSRIGWLEETAGQREKAEKETFKLNWSGKARAQAAFLRDRFEIDVKETAERVLGSDPTPHPYRRISRRKPTGFQLAVKSWRVHFEVHGRIIRVARLASGYAPEEVLKAEPETLHDHAAHQAFHRKWPQLVP
ncbi:MAG: tRNA (N6-threonylcarbamoyladenosine(37)-N6)-methyltransferase TrmO [Planctomycetota bacterium]|nr:tRNA (N6-threonylcarbamoyladenosine(37)-N6)-methyltransferase TrmO [Planctomycetota bacterium]